VRRIDVGDNQGANIAVTSGLKAGELVITEGVQKVRPGQVVTATPPQGVEPPDSIGSAGAETTEAAGQ
jgi:membrane fusion protein (multidrug efflux system)